MKDYRSNWNETFAPLGPAIKPKQEESERCLIWEFERCSHELPGTFLRADGQWAGDAFIGFNQFFAADGAGFNFDQTLVTAFSFDGAFNVWVKA